MGLSCVTTALRTAALAAVLLASAAEARAACYADYKAKREVPAAGFGFAEQLRLHYGVVLLSAESCSKRGAEAEIGRRIASEGWTLLRVISIFDETGLADRRQQAGAYFLRY